MSDRLYLKPFNAGLVEDEHRTAGAFLSFALHTDEGHSFVISRDDAQAFLDKLTAWLSERYAGSVGASNGNCAWWNEKAKLPCDAPNSRISSARAALCGAGTSDDVPFSGFLNPES